MEWSRVRDAEQDPKYDDDEAQMTRRRLDIQVGIWMTDWHESVFVLREHVWRAAKRQQFTTRRVSSWKWLWQREHKQRISTA